MRMSSLIPAPPRFVVTPLLHRIGHRAGVKRTGRSVRQRAPPTWPDDGSSLGIPAGRIALLSRRRLERGARILPESRIDAQAPGGPGGGPPGAGGPPACPMPPGGLVGEPG